MSGESVAVLAIPIGVIGIGGVVVVGVGAANVIKNIVDSRVEAAIREMELEKARMR